MNVGYVKVSISDQNPERQRELLKPYVEEIFEEIASGKDIERPQLQKILSSDRKGDTIYVESISRLTRNTLDFLKLVEQFTSKGINLVSLKENIDTSTPQGEFMVTVFAALLELERDITKEWQREGIEIARKEGRYGRPKFEFTKEFVDVYRKWKSGQITAVQAMRLLGLKKTAFYQRMRELEEQRFGMNLVQ